jgi:hypothetical protein
MSLLPFGAIYPNDRSSRQTMYCRRTDALASNMIMVPSLGSRAHQRIRLLTQILDSHA